MTYAAFEVCTIHVGDKLRRGVRAKCGYCNNEEEIAVNTVQSTHGNDDEVAERMVSHKFEKHGWKIGKVASQHRCPKCFTAIKGAAKHKENGMNKVVPINAEAPRPMSREDRRIIFEKLNDVYVSEKVGYSEDWNDEKVSKDLGVARAWVSSLREEMFGPDINEHTAKVLTEARTILTEIRNVHAQAEPICKHLQTLVAQANHIEKQIKEFLDKKA